VGKFDPSSLDFEPMFSGKSKLHEQPIRSLLYMYRGNYGKILLSTLFYVIKGSPIFALPIVTSNIINIVSHPNSHSLRMLWINLAVITLILLQNIPMHTLYVSYMSKATRFVEAGLRSTLIRKLQHLSISFHGELKSGMLQSKVLRDVEAVELLSKQVMISLMPSFANALIALGITLAKSLTVSAFFLLTIPGSVLLIRLFRRKIQTTNHDFRKEIEEMSGQVSEMVDMIPVTRAHGLEHVEIKRIDHVLENLRGKGYRLDLLEAYFGSSTWVTFHVFQVLCLIFTAYLAFEQKITVGDVVMYQGFFTMILNSVTQLMTVFPSIAKGVESVRSLTEILVSTDTEEYRGKRRLDCFKGRVSFKDVTFQYRGSAQPILQHLELEVEAGETIAIVGESGAGKSTILNLLIGFYKPTSGRLEIDGVPMDTLSMASYRQSIAVVPQTSILFSGSVRDNITYGLPSVSDLRLREVIEMANLTDFVRELPQGLETLLGENGGRLSGGQKQRIAIARALIRDPQIIIFDEATSALDNASEYHVQQAMSRLITGRTTFMVAHRLSTIRDANRIVVMKSGECVEVGSYEELMAQKGAFYELKKLQA